MILDMTLLFPFMFFSNEDVLEDEFFSSGRDYSSSWDDDDEDDEYEEDEDEDEDGDDQDDSWDI